MHDHITVGSSELRLYKPVHRLVQTCCATQPVSCVHGWYGGPLSGSVSHASESMWYRSPIAVVWRDPELCTSEVPLYLSVHNCQYNRRRSYNSTASHRSYAYVCNCEHVKKSVSRNIIRNVCGISLYRISQAVTVIP
jgi:hypothetical protein